MDLTPIFKAYDIRGLVPDQLDDAVAFRVGAAFASFTRAGRIAVGYDARLSSPVLADALIDGILATGCSVDELGMVATDMAYHAAGMLDEPAAMITASHNPKGWNGIKLCLAGAAPVGADTGLDQVRLLAEAGVPAAPTPGSRKRIDTATAYVEHVLSVVGSDAIGDLRVAADGGNGVAGVVLPALFERLDASLIGLYLDPDGSFPNHHPDPLRPENLRDLVALIQRDRPSLGVAFDGDADRAFFIDDLGVPLPGSTVTAMIASWFLEREPGARIVHNLICSRVVPETILARGGMPVRTRVGHSFIKAVMADTEAVFGGEHSGHYYFRDHFRADSGVLAMLVLLRLMSESGRPLSELRTAFEPYAQSGEVNLEVGDAAVAIAAVAAAFPGEHDRLDGLTVSLGSSWFNLRPSNTEPVIRLNVEAPDDAAVADLVARVSDVVAGVGHAGA